MDPPTCAHCGYELSGLAAAGRCPECGRGYNLETGQGTTARRQPWLVRHIRTLSLLGLAVVILGCSGLLSLVGRNAVSLVLCGLLFAGVTLAAAVLSYLSEKEDQRKAEG